MTTNSKTRRTFADRTERIDALLADPQRAQRVSEIREQMAEADRAYEMSLAMVRQAADLTQAQIAERLGVSQASVNQAEHKPDMLLSTLQAYLAAAGADLQLEVHLPNGQIAHIRLPLIHRPIPGEDPGPQTG